MKRFFAPTAVEARWSITCLVLLVLMSADVVSHGPLSHLDHVVRDAVQPRTAGTPTWMVLPGTMGEVGIGTALLVAVCLVTAQATWRLWPLALGVANLLTVELAVLVLKTVIGRPGPGALANRTGYPGYYPSGHTATSAVSAGTAIFLVCAWGSVRRLDLASIAGGVGGLVVGAISAARAILEDFHWLTDGLAGLLLASMVLTMGFAAARRYLSGSRTVGASP
jgi:undecaprenyl-diphosphatase